MWIKLAKIVFITITLLVAISLLAASLIAVFFDPNKLKPLITASVEKTSGYKLEIDGPLSWFFYPHLGVKAVHMRLTAPQQTAAVLELIDTSLSSSLRQWLRLGRYPRVQVDIAEVNAAKLRLHNVHAELLWQNHILTIKPITAYLYGGYLQGSLRGQELTTLPRWGVDLHLAKVQIEPLLQDYTEKRSALSLSGIASGDFTATTMGGNKQQLLARLNGTSEITVTQGSLTGINLNYLVQTAMALIDKQSPPPLQNLNETKLDRFSASVRINNGVAMTDNLILISPTLVTKGQGELHLDDFNLNVGLQTAPQQVHTDLIVPIRITGNLNNPVVQLDAIPMQKIIIQQNLIKLKENVQKKLEKLSGKTEQLLQSIIR